MINLFEIKSDFEKFHWNQWVGFVSLRKFHRCGFAQGGVLEQKMHFLL